MSLPRAALPSRPTARLPAGAWDCHVHVFGSRDAFPLATPRRYTPGLAPAEDLAAMLDRMGLTHAVIVQPLPYGNDHACLLDALAGMDNRCAGVASFAPDYRPAEQLLDRLQATGVTALRVHILHLPPTDGLSAALRAAAMAEELDWHVELQIDSARIGIVERIVRQCRRIFVLDHMARAEPADLSALARTGRVFVKLSGFYRQPADRSALDMARGFLKAMPEACLWGSDWPHTPRHPAEIGIAETPLPFRAVDAGADADSLFGSAASALVRTVLKDTPDRLYGRAVHRKTR